MSLRKMRLLPLLGGAALLAMVALPTSVASAAATTGSGASQYDCTGGNVPPGTYGSMIITGVCTMNTGNVTIKGNLQVAPKALLDAVTPNDPASKPTVPAVVTIRGNVLVDAGAVLLLGCSPNISCGPPSPGITYDRIGGNLTALGAQGVVVHSATIGGYVTVLGGGGGKAAHACAAQTAGKPIDQQLAPWSEDPGLDFTPVYTDFEDATIGGSLTVAGLDSCWIGSLRNEIGGNASYAGNNFGDPDAMEIDSNVIQGNLACFHNVPAVQFGDSNGAANLLGGHGFGECGFGVVLPNPAPEAISSGGAPGPSVPEHITVPLNSLGSFTGADVATNVGQLPPVTTSAGDTIVVSLNNFFITGGGLTGFGTFNQKLGPAASGQNVLATVFPNGSSEFTVYITCKCKFQGHAGTISIRAYGTSTAGGATSGIFLVTSGGGTPISGSLATLVGWGTFSNMGQPQGRLRLVEHLGFAS
jgi:hypothetical protein